MINEEGGSGDIVSMRIKKWVAEIKNQSHLIAGFNKDIEHWRKRELAAAILCGEHLVNIRKTYGNRGDGFKSFVEAEFQKEFCYKTASRYMKLFHGKHKLNETVVSLNQAYHYLGVVKDENAGAKDGSNNDKQSGNQHSSARKTKRPRKRTQSSHRSKNLSSIPRLDSVLIPYHNGDTDVVELVEFNIDPEGNVIGRQLGRSEKFKKVLPSGLQKFHQHLARYVDKQNGLPKRIQGPSTGYEVIVSLSE